MRQMMVLLLFIVLVLVPFPADKALAETVSSNPAPQLPLASPINDLRLAVEHSGSAEWWAVVQKDIADSEYHITWQEGTYLPDIEAAYQAPNRAHNLRTYFIPQGIRVICRTATTPDWVWGLSLTGYGYQGDVSPVLPAELAASENHVEYCRGNVTEWYLNDQRGLEQGFVLYAPPPGPKATSQVILTMDVDGELNIAVEGSEDSLDFTTNSGVRVLRYGELHVSDGSGQELPAKLTACQRQINIVIDAQDAVYPITVDPLVTTPSWTAESNQANASFGYSVASAGDVNGDGYSDIIVGAPVYDNGQTDEGRAFVYHGSASGLSATANWTAESNQALACEFGISVASAGDVNGDGYSDVIVGIPNYDDGSDYDQGRAFVYHGSASGLSATASWWAEGFTGANNNFGYSVASAGDVNGDSYSDVIVGVPYAGAFDSGRAYVYRGSALGLNPNYSWTAGNQQNGALFGYSVASAGDVNGDGYGDVIVGAPLYDDGQTDEGMAFVYLGPALGANPSWTAESNQVGAYFGWSVASAGDINGDGYSDVIVGAPYYDGGQTDEGRVYVYHGSASGLNPSANWLAERNQASANLGWSVAGAGDVNDDDCSEVIIGAPYYDGGETDEGKAFVWHGSASGLGANPNWTAESDQVNAYFSCSVASAGDVNGDGCSDVIVGAPGYDNGQTDEGRAFVYYSLVPGITVTPTSGLVTTEAGGTATFTVVLNTPPAADVTIGLSSSDTTEGTVAPSSLTFTSANWNTPQTVTVTGVDDAIVDGNITYQVITAPATSADLNYNNLDASDVSVTNNDNDVTPPGALGGLALWIWITIGVGAVLIIVISILIGHHLVRRRTL